MALRRRHDLLIYCYGDWTKQRRGMASIVLSKNMLLKWMAHNWDCTAQLSDRATKRKYPTHAWDLQTYVVAIFYDRNLQNVLYTLLSLICFPGSGSFHWAQLLLDCACAVASGLVGDLPLTCQQRISCTIIPLKLSNADFTTKRPRNRYILLIVRVQTLIYRYIEPLVVY